MKMPAILLTWMCIVSFLIPIVFFAQVMAAEVTSVLPPGGSHQAPIDTNLTVGLDADIDPVTVNAGTVVTHGGFSAPVPGTFTTDTTTFTFDPDYDFHPGELIETTITKGVEAGGLPVDPYVWQFCTRTTAGIGTFFDSGQSLGSHKCRSVALGDLDGDYDLDAVTAVDKEWNVPSSEGNFVWINDGNGNFSGNGQVWDSNTRMCIALGDLDNDGDLDIIVSNGNDGIQVWLNNGSGVFIDSGLSIGHDYINRVCLGDLDGDGDLDAIVAIPGYHDYSQVWLNDGTGFFTSTGQLIGFDLGTNNVAVGDLDGDGDLDAFITYDDGYGSTSCRVWLNTGIGIFSDTGQSLGITGSRGVDLGDVDNDGDLDAFVFNVYNYGCSVWLNNGSGVFTDSSQTLGINFSIKGISLSDVDGDGDLDAFAVSSAGNPVFINTGTGTFIDVSYSPGTPGGYDVAMGDLDGDEDLDAVIADEFGSRILFNQVLPTPTATQTPGPIVSVFPEPESHTAQRNTDLSVTMDVPLAPGSVNGSTFIVHGGFSGGTSGEFDVDSYSFTFNPSDDFLPGERIQATVTDGMEVSGIPVAPYVWSFQTDVSVSQATFVASSQSFQSTYSYGVSFGDLDSDGDLDAVVGNGSEDTQTLINTGNGIFTELGQSDICATGIVVLGDLDGDGDLDVLAKCNDAPVWLNDGNGIFTSTGPADIFDDWDSPPVLGDLDGDGDLDMVVVGRDVSARVYLNDGNGSFDLTNLINCFGRDVDLGDFDNDGDLDIFISPVDIEHNCVWLNDGSGNFASTGQILLFEFPLNAALGDLDSDCDLDVIMVNEDDTRVWLNDGSGVLSDSGQSLGDALGGNIGLGDLDGDGDLDAIVINYEESSGNYVLLNDGLGNFAETGQFLDNFRGYSVALGDLDGDGDLDAYITDDSNDRVWLNQNPPTPTPAETATPAPIPASGPIGLGALILILSAGLITIGLKRKRIQ